MAKCDALKSSAAKKQALFNEKLSESVGNKNKYGTPWNLLVYSRKRLLQTLMQLPMQLIITRY